MSLSVVNLIFFFFLLSTTLNYSLAQKPLILSGYVGGKYSELIVNHNDNKNFSATLINQFDYLRTEFSVEEEPSIFLNFKTNDFQSYIQTIRLIKNYQQNAYKGFYYASDGHIGHVEFKMKETLTSKEDNFFFISFNQLFRKFTNDFDISFPEKSQLFEFDPQTTSYYLNENIFIEQQMLPELVSVENNFLSVLLKSFGDSTQKIERRISFLKNSHLQDEGCLVLYEQKKTYLNSNEHYNEIYCGYFETDKQKKTDEWNNLSEKRILREDALSKEKQFYISLQKNKNFTLIKLKKDYQIQFKPDSLVINIKSDKEQNLDNSINILIEKGGVIRIKSH